MSEYPIEQSFEDFSGQTRIFKIYLDEPRVGGYSLYAEEIAENDSQNGYKFRSHSGTSASLAHSKLLKKIKKELAIRYLKKNGEKIDLTHDKIKGRITSGGLSIDGSFVPFDELTDLLQSYESFNIKIEISDPSDII